MHHLWGRPCKQKKKVNNNNNNVKQCQTLVGEELWLLTFFLRFAIELVEPHGAVFAASDQPVGIKLQSDDLSRMACYVVKCC